MWKKFENIKQLSPVKVYQLVLTGKLIQFPKGTWNQPDSTEYAIPIIRYLIEEVLKWNDEDIKKKFSTKTFSDNRLGGLLSITFNNCPFKALDSVYPGKYREWELQSTPKNYWTRDTVIQTIKWLIEEKLMWTDEDIKKNLSNKVFHNHGLKKLLESPIINESTYQAIQLTYPGRFKPWELPSVGHNFWTKETSIQAIRWLIEQKLKWTDEDIKINLGVKIFTENGLRGLLRLYFNDSPFQAINTVYPDRFRICDFPKKITKDPKIKADNDS